MKLRRTLLSLLLAALLLLSCGASAFAEGEASPFALTVTVGERQTRVRVLQNDFTGNYFLSLTDLSAALADSPRSFRFSYQYTQADGEYFTVRTGEGPGESGGGEGVSREPVISSFLLFQYRIFVDGQEQRRYCYRLGTDLYMGLTDVQLLLDLTAEFTPEGLLLDPERPFRPDIFSLDEQGYFESFNAVLLADADTGAVVYARNASTSVPIASLTKLMTYLLLSEDLQAGAVSSLDPVPISDRAVALSRSADGIIRLRPETRIPLWELTAAMLLASSNESALAVAEYLSGSEEAFVARMNRRAQELGLESAVFYNPNGLPCYLPGAVTAKLQNLMSAEDLLVLCRSLLENCPEITDYSSLSYGYMPTLNYNTANSNALVFNLEGCCGLKTGSTNKAGFCLAAILPVTADGQTHNAIAIVLGAESPDVRNQATEILLRYARDSWPENGFPVSGGARQGGN